jgi:hypothetical protein
MKVRPLRALRHLWRWSQKSPGERRVAKERARFWAELRDGQREAEARRAPGVRAHQR